MNINTNISKKDQALLVILAGIGVFALCWFLIISPFNDKTLVLQNENVQLKATADLYEAINARSADYTKGLTDMQNRIDSIQASYPVNISRTDEIMYLSNMESLYARNLAIESMSMSAIEEVIAPVMEDTSAQPVDTNTLEETAQEASGETTDTSVPEGTEATDTLDVPQGSLVKLYKMPLNYNFRCTYAGAKEMLNYIYEQGDKKSISAMNLAFDSETGNLMGSITLDLYFMTGTGKAYNATTIPPTVKGVEDIFHTVNGAQGVNSVLAVEDEAEDSEDNEEEDSEESEDEE